MLCLGWAVLSHTREPKFLDTLLLPFSVLAQPQGGHMNRPSQSDPLLGHGPSIVLQEPWVWLEVIIDVMLVADPLIPAHFPALVLESLTLRTPIPFQQVYFFPLTFPELVLWLTTKSLANAETLIFWMQRWETYSNHLKKSGVYCRNTGSNMGNGGAEMSRHP